MISKLNRIVKVTVITIMQFVLIAFSALVLHLNRNLVGVEAFGATYNIQLTAFLISAIIFMSGILLYDYIYLNLLKNSKSKKILLTLYYLMIYILRIFVAAFLVFGVFDFYLINSDYELSVNLQNIGFYIFPMISPIAIGIILLVQYKFNSNQISKNNHEDIHHMHPHLKKVINEHSHEHEHNEISHSHEHNEDVHHIHIHKN